MALEDIEKLKERVEKNPTSNLFVILAEEYKKAGMLDDALDVLIRGLERLPGYMSARVALGKIFLEKGMLYEASEEFEKVVSAIPDNLYAHKKLAEIYRDIGESDRAIREFKTLLSLNPGDEEAARNLAELEGRGISQPEITGITGEEKPFEVPISKELVEEEVYKESEIAAGEIEETLKKEVSEEPRLSLGDAEAYISQGSYMKAMDVYERILSVEPNDVRVLQRAEELKALLRLLGTDKELIARLNSLLEGIKKKRDEFYGNP